VHLAVSLLAKGEVVALPTETVYGLAGSIDSDAAIAQIFSLKERPASNPLIVHIQCMAMLDEVAIDIPESARLIMQHFWPGPLTIVLKKSNRVSYRVTAGQDTVAVRMPAHPMMLAVLKELNCPLAAPSANRFTKVSPTTAAHVASQFEGKIPLILDGGRCQTGIESTIIDATDPTGFRVLREGVLRGETISALTGVPEIHSAPNQPTILTPGQHKVHYSPNTPLYRFETPLALQQLHDHFHDKHIGVLVQSYPIDFQSEILHMPNNPVDYAHALYHRLHEADALEVDVLFIEMPPQDTPWRALRDKVTRASRLLTSD
jgi:L-threonylcarbamoyladenylate synthase